LSFVETSTRAKHGQPLVGNHVIVTQPPISCSSSITTDKKYALQSQMLVLGVSFLTFSLNRHTFHSSLQRFTGWSRVSNTHPRIGCQTNMENFFRLLQPQRHLVSHTDEDSAHRCFDFFFLFGLLDSAPTSSFTSTTTWSSGRSELTSRKCSYWKYKWCWNECFVLFSI
jgi:hypothetical protein